MTTVSVVIPTHNRRASLARAVRSVLAQEGVDLQVLVVDDGSAPAVRPWTDARVRVLRNDRAEGVAAARNRGLDEASGEWIAFLDDDDIWAATKLAAQLRSAAATTAWSFTGAVSVDPTLEVVSTTRAFIEAAQSIDRRNAIPAGASNVVVRAEVMHEAGRFDRRLRHMADWDMWIRVGTLGPAVAVDEPAVAYVQHAGNSSLDVATVPAEMDIIRSRYGGRIDEAYVWRWIAWSHLRSGRRGAAARAYLRAVRAGDVRSLGRLIAGAAAPGWAVAGRNRADAAYAARAIEWLEAFRAVS